MRKKLFLKITAVCLFLVMLLSFASCDFMKKKDDTKSGGEGNEQKQEQKNETSTLKPDKIKILTDLANYSKSASDYNIDAEATAFSGDTYDSKPCQDQLDALANRIEKKTKDVWLGKTESAATKIFTKSTPEGIMSAIAKARLTYDEMVRVVDYIAGETEVDADVDSFIVENNDGSWSGSLTGDKTHLNTWNEVGNGKDLNEGWCFFDDWDLYDRLKDYSKSSTNNLGKNDRSTLAKINDIGTKAIAGDNASWQYRSILEKVYKPKAQGGLDLPGATAARLATCMLDYGNAVAESMSGGKVAESTSDNKSAFSVYFRTKVNKPDNLPDEDVAQAKALWNPYAGLGDYDMLSYLLAFYDFYKGNNKYKTMSGIQSCAELYGFYYQYNQTYYNVVLKDKATYESQLLYEKLNTFTEKQWLDYVKIQRNNYAGSYRYSSDFYQEFYTIHFNFQARKESSENVVYEIGNVVPGKSYTTEMQSAILSSKKGIAGQLAMSDWMWCYGGSDASMKDYNSANTKYQEGKLKTKNAEFEGKFYYEFEQLKIADYLFGNMKDTELSGALYYNCYAYSGSLISEIQGYEKNKVLITDAIKTYDKFTSIALQEYDAITGADKEDEYAIGKLNTLQGQGKADWDETKVADKAEAAYTQSWNDMRDELKAARKYDYQKVKSNDTQKNDWEVRCEYLEDRVIRRYYSCCETPISEPEKNTTNCNHAQNPNGTAVTKEYDTKCAISKFVSQYENILYYIATQVKVEFDTPETGYKTTTSDDAAYDVGYNGTIAQLIADSKRPNGNEEGITMSYVKNNTMTMKLGSTFQEEIIEDNGDDADWWTKNKEGTDTVAKRNDDKYTETYGSGNGTEYVYKYEFKGWFLDKECKYYFNPDDDIDFNIKLYAGYKVTKSAAK